MSERPNPWVVGQLKEMGFSTDKSYKIVFWTNIILTVITLICFVLGSIEIYELKEDFKVNGCSAFYEQPLSVSPNISLDLRETNLNTYKEQKLNK